MGAKGSKKDVPPKPPKLKSKDLKFLAKQTGMSEEDIEGIFNKFHENNPDMVLSRGEFFKIYNELRPESAEAIDEIANYIFACFDTDNNGTINFNEFMVSYAMTSRGDVEDKLDYAFDLYDVDDNQTLNKAELRNVLDCMLDLLGADEKGHDANCLAEDFMNQLDGSGDGTITKEEFINGLSSNYSLRAVMSPFN